MKKIIYIFSAALLCLASCSREVVPVQQAIRTTSVAPAEGDLARVTFTITIPETALYATQTRAQHNMGLQPSTIDNGDLFVAVFGAGDSDGLGGQLQHFLQATLKKDESDPGPAIGSNPPINHDLTGEGDDTKVYKYVYEVLMPLSTEPLVLDFMAGACDSEGNLYTLANPLPVKYEKDVMPLLFSVNGKAAYWQRKRIDGVFPHMIQNASGEWVYEMTQYVDEDGLPLSDADQDYVADKIAALHDVQLIRNFAKITYKASATAPFTIDGFYLVDTPVSGTVAPYSATDGYNTDYTRDYESAQDAAVAILGGTYKGYVGSQVLNSGIPEGNDFFTDAGDFEYMYERTIPTQSAPAFAESGALLKVTYKNTALDASLRGTTRYYKVSFVDKDGYIPILRNIEYEFDIDDITSDQHPTSPGAAYAGGFLGDVSGSVATAMLDEISNNKSKIVVSKMSQTSIGTGKSFDINFYFYPVASNSEVVVTSGKASQAAGGKPVTISTEIETEGNYPQAITSVSDVVVTREDNADQFGTITVTVGNSEEGVVKRGKVKILGAVEGLRPLYREIVFTVMDKQVFAKSTTTTSDDGETVTTVSESTVSGPISDEMDQDVTVTLMLPDDLPRDIFPLQIMIEAEKNSIYSIASNGVSALPAKYGESAFDSSKNNYYFVKTITFDDYARLNGVTYQYTNAFPCYFKTRLSSGNGTKIKINDFDKEYFVEKELALVAN